MVPDVIRSQIGLNTLREKLASFLWFSPPCGGDYRGGSRL